MWQVREVKVIVLTRGGLTGDENVNPCGDAGLNREKSAEAIVPAEAGKG
jgi:hypothetical protein